MSIVESKFGKTKNNNEVKLFTIKNRNNMEVKIINYGGAIVSIRTADKSGKFDDVVLGYDNLQSYENGDKFFGAIIGRCGNRIENSKFSINGKEYILAANDGKNHLHGGIKGFDKVVWNAEIVNREENVLKLSYLSKDGEEGYPGNLNVNVYYELTDENELVIKYEAVSDKDTVVNLTNHSYFNLSGNLAGDILDEKLMLNSSEFTVNDKYSIPTGEIRDVNNTPMDFRTLRKIGDDINLDDEQIKFGNGYDHNWMLDNDGDITKIAAKLIDENTGRTMEVYTTNKAIQFYSANFLDGSDIGKNNVPYIQRSGVCLETQYVPNSINDSNFESCLLKADEKYQHKTIYKFSIL
ncbi:MAG: galactose mutarotase [Clostridium sp.]|jgi:aldose 1-epimerase|nr:galactose mutarotase [Clostridium sp.]